MTIDSSRLQPDESAPGLLSSGPSARSLPICVDLDGTLVKTDLLLESAISAVLKDLLNFFRIIGWSFRGKAAMKEKIAATGPVNPSTISYNEDLLEYLKKERRGGRRIVLATASDRRIAERIALHLGIFDDVVASDGVTNRKGEAKADALVERFGERGFVYAGDGRCDIEVWRRADSAILVNASRSVSRQVRGLCPVTREFRGADRGLRAFLKGIRPHQWLKNLLVFASPLAGHTLFDPGVLGSALACFLAFCFAASGVYIINDLLDLEADRRNRWKRGRPFAAGDLPLRYGLMGPVFFGIAIALGFLVSAEVALIVHIYVTAALAYSHYLKTRPLVDVFCLAFLYTIRVFAGGSASGTGVSIWLLNFSGFLFLSLGFLKRYSEYSSGDAKGAAAAANRRGYTGYDSLLIIIMGVSSSFVAAVIFAFYVNSTQGQIAYRTPALLWGVVPLVLFWQLRLWLATVRGHMHSDPLAYATRDRVSFLVFGLVIAFYALATVGVPFVTG